MDLVLFGIQGSGKGTQAQRLCRELGYYLFEAGGELRAIAASGTELGETVKSYIDVGKLVPFAIIMQVVREAIVAQPPDQRILFDGIPRDEDQMRAFDAIMQDVGRAFRCIQILLDEAEAVQRILGRAAEQGRADDADETIIRKRMDTFRSKTLPVIQAYAQQGKLSEVDGSGGMDEVYERITHTVNAFT
ncbi:adenylate kinase [Candidatus Peribacteria bacterium]|nr:adenylate kinase [Candidatus Peribacteria bacterium]